MILSNSFLLGLQIPYLGFCSCEEQGDTGVWQLVDPPILPLTHGPNHTFDWREMLLQEWHLPLPNIPSLSLLHTRTHFRPEPVQYWNLSTSLHSCWLSIDSWKSEVSCLKMRRCIPVVEWWVNWLRPSVANVYSNLHTQISFYYYFQKNDGGVRSGSMTGWCSHFVGELSLAFSSTILWYCQPDFWWN